MTGALLALAYPTVSDAGARLRRTAISCPAGVAPCCPRATHVERGVPGRGRDGRCIAGRAHLLAAAISVGEIEALYEDRIVDEQVVQWNARDNSVLARRRRRLGALLIEDKPMARPDPDKVKAAMLEGIRQRGLPWTDELSDWRQRIAFLRGIDESWPDLSDKALLASVDDWLAPFVDGGSKRIDFAAALKLWCRGTGSGGSDSLAPTHIEVPSGSRVPIDYTNPAEPTLSVRLQEMFGLTDTPRIGGKVPVLIHLLSPARRPVQVTRDLASFWTNGYKAVKAELKGRYPRHYWPDDPLVAEPTAG